MENSKRIIALLIFCLYAPLFLKAGNNPGGTKNILYISLIETIERTMREKFRDKTNVSFIIKYGASRTIESDKELLSRVIGNLVNNAFKNTDTGSVTLEYSIEKNMLTNKVIDTGDGIPESYKKFIFKQFDKLNIKKYINGAGVGLPVSKTIINLMGGKIDFSSQEGVGSTFWFTIPCDPE